MSSEVETPRRERAAHQPEQTRGSSTALGRTRKIALALLITLSLDRVAAQESPSLSPSPSPTEARSVRISFLPPPLDGTISLGIYDAKGKLVRVLYREADINEFTIGNDALSTTWDGKDDAGENAPMGKYSAHGFVVGDLGIEGVGFFFNDFVTGDDSPRIRHLRNVRLHDNELHLDVDLAGEGKATVVLDSKQPASVRKVSLESATHCEEKSPLPNVTEAIDCAAGSNNTLWLIDKVEGGARREVKQLSKTRELLRRMAIEQNEPQPNFIAASPTEDRFFLVEESPSMNRLRALSLAASKTEGAGAAISDWKIDFEKKITEHKNFSVVDGKPVASPPGGAGAPETLKVKLAPNPLLGDDRTTVEMAVGFDADGSFLKTTDGLPLCSISETADLTRALLIAHGPNALDVFQDDGAVVEQFRVTGVDQMMSFDCGGFELK
ncbi:MAG: FlgD Ig-like domain [Verrucomicrobiota bacterium]|jgi:hypothetical protein